MNNPTAPSPKVTTGCGCVFKDIDVECQTPGCPICTSPAPDAVSVVVLNDVCEKLLEYMASEKNVFKLRQGMSKIIEAYATTREQKARESALEEAARWIGPKTGKKMLQALKQTNGE